MQKKYFYSLPRPFEKVHFTPKNGYCAVFSEYSCTYIYTLESANGIWCQVSIFISNFSKRNIGSDMKIKIIFTEFYQKLPELVAKTNFIHNYLPVSWYVLHNQFIFLSEQILFNAVHCENCRLSRVKIKSIILEKAKLGVTLFSSSVITHH